MLWRIWPDDVSYTRNDLSLEMLLNPEWMKANIITLFERESRHLLSYIVALFLLLHTYSINEQFKMMWKDKIKIFFFHLNIHLIHFQTLKIKEVFFFSFQFDAKCMLVCFHDLALKKRSKLQQEFKCILVLNILYILKKRKYNCTSGNSVIGTCTNPCTNSEHVLAKKYLKIAKSVYRPTYKCQLTISI